MELVYIEWEDAAGVDDSLGWVHRADLKPSVPTIFHTAGFVVESGPDFVVLTEAYSDHFLAPRTRIPTGMIRRHIYLDAFIKETD